MRAAALTATREPLEPQAVDRPEPALDGVVAGLVAVADDDTVDSPVVDRFA